MSEKTQAQLLKEKLFYKKKNVFEERSDEEIELAYAYAEGYKQYLDAAKTEREAVTAAIKLAEAKGYVPYTLGGELKAGGKYYLNNRGKSLFLIKMGTESPECGLRINDQMEVIDKRGAVIPGLYAGWHTAGGANGAFNIAGRPFNGIYGDLGQSFVGGFMAANALVKKLNEEA